MQLLQPGELLAAEPIVRVACGDWHTICVAVDGTAYSFGNGDHGKLGLGHELAQHEPAAITFEYFNFMDPSRG